MEYRLPGFLRFDELWGQVALDGSSPKHDVP
jgi:hypothetical protein